MTELEETLHDHKASIIEKIICEGDLGWIEYSIQLNTGKIHQLDGRYLPKAVEEVYKKFKIPSQQLYY